MKYEVIITRTGGIAVEANCAEDAIEKVNEMSIKDIEAHAQLTGWEASDAERIE